MPELLLNLLWRVPLALACLAATAWGGLALHFRGPASIAVGRLGMALWLLLGLLTALAIIVPAGDGWRAILYTVFGLTLAGLCLWWRTIRPSHARDWAPDVARLLDSAHDGDCVTLYNVRHFDWRSRDDFTQRWETRSYDLSRLQSVDLFLSYWMGPAIAHTLVSFGFADGRQLVFSVEVRRTSGQSFSTVGGFFKQSELILVAADERDIVRTRSNVRGEDVYIYRVKLPARERRALFEAYLREAEALRHQPRFYNTLFSNCTTIVHDMVTRIVPGLPKDIRLLLSGYLPDYIYELGALDTSQPLDTLRKRGYINPRAIASDIDDGASERFSRAIRRGVPSPRGQAIKSE